MKEIYGLWIRWTSGAEDKFALTKREWTKIQARGEIFMRMDAWDNTRIYIHTKEVVAWKLFIGPTPKGCLNPLNHDDHYDNPNN